MKILSDHKGWVNGVAWAKIDPFSEVTANLKGNLATLASDRCLRVFNASTKNFKNIAKTHRCKLKVPVSRNKEKECIKDDELSTKVCITNVVNFKIRGEGLKFCMTFLDLNVIFNYRLKD